MGHKALHYDSLGRTGAIRVYQVKHVRISMCGQIEPVDKLLFRVSVGWSNIDVELFISAWSAFILVHLYWPESQPRLRGELYVIRRASRLRTWKRSLALNKVHLGSSNKRSWTIMMGVVSLLPGKRHSLRNVTGTLVIPWRDGWDTSRR